MRTRRKIKPPPQGWFLLHRKMIDDDLWTSEPMTKGQALVDLIAIADYEGSSKGQVRASITQLAERWQWGRGKVNHFLKQLEQDGTIKKGGKQLAEQNANSIFLYNYEAYQRPQNSMKTDYKQEGGVTACSTREKEPPKEDIKKYKEDIDNNNYNKPYRIMVDDPSIMIAWDGFLKAIPSSWPKHRLGIESATCYRSAYTEYRKALRGGVIAEDISAAVNYYVDYKQATGESYHSLHSWLLGSKWLEDWKGKLQEVTKNGNRNKQLQGFAAAIGFEAK